MMPTSALKRSTEFRAAFDRRDPDPSKNYGIHGVELKMLVRGSKGAIQFVVYTNWHLPHVTEELDNKLDRRFSHLSCHPMPSDLGYHSPVPLYEGQTSMGECKYLDGKECYYDGSTTNAEKVFEVLVRDGGEACWKELEDYYHSTFAKEEKSS
jgi:hypothetical protein